MPRVNLVEVQGCGPDVFMLELLAQGPILESTALGNSWPPCVFKQREKLVAIVADNARTMGSRFMIVSLVIRGDAFRASGDELSFRGWILNAMDTPLDTEAG